MNTRKIATAVLAGVDAKNGASLQEMAERPIESKPYARKFTSSKHLTSTDPVIRKATQKLLKRYLLGSPLSRFIGVEAYNSIAESGMRVSPGSNINGLGMRHSDGRLPAKDMRRRVIAEQEKIKEEVKRKAGADKRAAKRLKLKVKGFTKSEIRERMNGL